jgi:hypothetical protein
MSLRRLNASLLSPLLLFPLVWALTALLAQIHLLHIQGPWSTVMVAVVVAVPLAFIAGGLIGEGIAQMATASSSERSETRISERALRRLLLALIGLGLLAVAYQFARAGRPPLLSGSIDEARFSQGGPTILLTDLLTVAVILAMTLARNPLGRESRFELGLSLVALGAFALQAGRGNVILPIVVVIVARWLYWGRPSPYLITAGGLVAFLAICAGFYLRTYQHPTTPFEAELFGEVLPPLPFFIKPLIPVYLALTTNFVALEGLVGAFDAVALDSFFSGARHIGEVSAELTPPWVTSTIAGSLWADGGFWALIPGVAGAGALAAGAYAAAARTRSFRWCLVSAYLTFIALFGLYTNLWTQQIDWLIVAPLLLIFGAFAENPSAPPGVVGAVWGKIRRMPTPARAAVPSGEAVKSDSTGNGPEDRRGGVARAAIISGLMAIAVLLVAGLAVQSTLPEPFPLVRTMRLPTSVASADAVFTDSQRASENTSVWWINRSEQTAALRRFDPGTEEAELTARFSAPRLPGRTYYDIGAWSPMRVPALFEIRQASRRLYITVRKSVGGATVARYSQPIEAPEPGLYRSFGTATFSGPRSDLLIVDRGSTKTRVRLGILSGESGFKERIIGTYLPFRGLRPNRWSLEIGELAGGTLRNGETANPRPDLILVERDPDRTHSSLDVIAGESEEPYEGFAYQRDIDEPGDLPPSRFFLQGSWRGAPDLFEVAPEAAGGPVLKIFDIQAPAGFL